MRRPVFLLAAVAGVVLTAAPRADATSVPMWLAVEVTQVDAGITSLAVGDRFAIALVVNDSVLDQESSIGAGRFPGLLSSFTMTAFPTNAGSWTPSGTFDVPGSHYVTNAFGNGMTFAVRGTGFPDGGAGLPFLDVDLNFAWLGDITDSGLGDSLAQQLGATFDPTRAVLGAGASIRFSTPAIPEATLAVASNFFLWTNAGTGNWTTATNWRPHGLPTSSSDVNISNGGTAQITMAGAQAQDVFLGQQLFGGSGHLEVAAAPASLSARRIVVGSDGTGTLTIAAGADVSTTNGGDIGIQDGSSGTVTVTGAGSTWTNSSDLELGESGDASLTISNGALVTSTAGQLADDDSNTFVTVTGAGSRWNMSGDLLVADDGQATLGILDGGTVSNINATIGADTVAVGTVMVAGAGSTWTNNGTLTVGVEAQGSLTIEDGGTVSNMAGSIGLLAGSNGAVTVTGSGSSWTNGQLTVGDSGTGSLTIEAGGDVSNQGGIIAANSASSGTVLVSGVGSTWNNNNLNLRVGHFGTGALTIEAGGHVSNLHAVVGDFAGSSGTAIVRGAGSTWTSSANLLVAHSTTGTLTIEAGGMVSNVDGTIGHDTGSMGTVIVTGAGSTWANTGELTIGNEDTGTGTMNIAAGGSVSNTNGTMGVDANASGTVTVTGAGSTWINNGDLAIGLNGAGELTVEEGGSVSNNIGVLAFGTGSTGTANVTGAGSNWTSDSFLIVGVDGVGELTIAGGGSVSNTIGEISRFPGSTSTALVTGAGSTWTNSGALAVADEGTGTLTIQAGGHVSSTNGVIGFATGSSGVATLSGTGSTWAMSGKLGLGGDATTLTNGGSGTLKIQSGAAVNVAQGLVLFPNGKLKLEGGTLDTSSVSFQGGGEFSFFAGTLHVGTFNGSLLNQGGALAPGHSAGSTTIIGNYTQQTGATLEFEIGGTSAGGTYDLVGVTGIVILGGELQLSMLNGFVPSPINTFTVLNSAGGIFGVFSNVTTGQRLTTSDGNGSFIVNYGPGSAFNQNQIVLSAFQSPELPGDFNLDGKVDAADYVKWRKGLGTNYTPAHLNVWRSNFGATAGSGIGSLEAPASNAIVPEPGSLILILVGANIVQVRRWRFAPLSAI